jgi:hypothetical protein
MNKIEYSLRLAKDCTYADEMMESAKEHLRNVIDEALKEVLPQTDVMLSLPDIRNKLSPIKNLIAMIEIGLVKGNVEMHDLVLKEIESCKESIAYLSGNGA